VSIAEKSKIKEGSIDSADKGSALLPILAQGVVQQLTSSLANSPPLRSSFLGSRQSAQLQSSKLLKAPREQKHKNETLSSPFRSI
jgi:hypothetical protein